MTLSTISEDQLTSTGDTVANIVLSGGGDRITDPDTGADRRDSDHSHQQQQRKRGSTQSMADRVGQRLEPCRIARRCSCEVPIYCASCRMVKMALRPM